MKKSKTYVLELNVNGVWEKTDVSPHDSLLQVLRDRLKHTDVKAGCGKGNCGTCAVLLNGKAVNACLTLALQAHRQEVITLKGIGTPENPHPLQQSFVNHGAIQCGFCTPGMIVSAKALLDQKPHPTRDDIREAISGNLCRCTGYKKIIDAIEEVANTMAKKRSVKGNGP